MWKEEQFTPFNCYNEIIHMRNQQTITMSIESRLSFQEAVTRGEIKKENDLKEYNSISMMRKVFQ